MFAVDQLLFVGALLLLSGIALSKFSARFGVPVLVLFLGVGMLAGSEGLGRIEFENYVLAHGIGTIALAVIIFDGGLRTSKSAVLGALGPSLTLATAGVLVTALVTGWAASLLLGIGLLEGLLLGSIVGSTDAAAVFAILRSRGLHLPGRLSATLEVESGSNDPMAVFLTIALLEVLLGRMPLGPELGWLFVRQMSIGAIVGFAVGRGTVYAINRINLDAAGLYPVLTAAAGLLAYGLAATLGGSGFLSVYLAGILIGNARLVFKRGVLLFHDGAAWLSQIVMFVLLGLLSFPSRLIEAAPQGLIVAAVLTLVARPFACAALLLPFGFRARETAFVSWVGLKGAVPIVLATYPLLFGLQGGEGLFDVVFFVVLVSALTQGWSIPLVARLLRLEAPARPEPPVTLEITSIRDLASDIVEYVVTPDSRAAGRFVRDLKLPDGAVVALVARGHNVIPPRGSTRLESDDHAFLVLQHDVRPLVDRIFSREAPALELPALIEFPLRGDTTVADLADYYGIVLPSDPSTQLADLLRDRLGEVQVGSILDVGPVRLTVREVIGGRVETVGLAIRVDAAGSMDEPAE